MLGKKNLPASFQQFLLSTRCYSVQTVRNQCKTFTFCITYIEIANCCCRHPSILHAQLLYISACYLSHQKHLFFKVGLKNRINILISGLIQNDRTDRADTLTENCHSDEKTSAPIREEKQNFNFYIQKKHCFCIKASSVLVHSFTFSMKERLSFKLFNLSARKHNE